MFQSAKLLPLQIVSCHVSTVGDGANVLILILVPAHFDSVKMVNFSGLVDTFQVKGGHLRWFEVTVTRVVRVM